MTIHKLNDLLLNRTPPENDCKGRVYRARRNIFLNSKGHYIEKLSMIPLKRLSCSGCKHCGWVDEYFNEYAADGLIQIEPDFEDGKLYELTTLKAYYDWETGIIDDFDMGFNKIGVESNANSC